MIIQKMIAIIAVLSIIISANSYGRIFQSRNSAPAPINNNNINLQNNPMQDTTTHPAKKHKPTLDSSKHKQGNNLDKKMYPGNNAMPKRDTVQ